MKFSDFSFLNYQHLPHVSFSSHYLLISQCKSQICVSKLKYCCSSVEMLVFSMLLALVLLREARLVDLIFNFVLHSSISLISDKKLQVSNHSTARSRFSTCLSANFLQISSTWALNGLRILLALLAPKILVPQFKPLGFKFLIPYPRFLFQVFIP